MIQIFLLLLSLFSTPALAQCTGIFPGGTVCGNSNASTATQPSPTAISKFTAGSTSNLNVYRTQIPTVNIGSNTTIILNGYRKEGDRGMGAVYTSVNATSTGWGAIQDINGVWFNLVLNVSGFINNYSNGGKISSGWFGTYGDNGSEAITSGDISANPQWRGTYVVGDTWDYVGTQEAIYAAFATGSTPGSISWNAIAGSFNTVLYIPPGQYDINETIKATMQSFTIEFASRGGSTDFFWVGASYATMWLFNSAAYGTVYNLSADCSTPGNATFSAATNNPCVKLDHNGASPGGLKTQQLTFINPYIVVGLNGQGMGINVDASSSGQGDTVTLINPYFAGDFLSSLYGVQTNGANTLELVIINGDFQGFPVNGVWNTGGNVYMYGTHFEGENLNGSSKTPILNQLTTGGADVRNDGSVSSVNPTYLGSVRSEAEIISQACCGGLNDITSSVTTGSDISAWTSSNPYMAGQLIHGGSNNRVFMVVDNGGACSQFCAMTPGVGTDTFTDSGASYTTNQWVNYYAWLRNPTNGNTFACQITANTATTITYSSSHCGTLAAGQTQYQIGGVSGGSPPSWDGATRGYSFLNSFGTTSGSSCVGIDGGAFATVSNNDWVVIPYGDQLTQTGITGTLTFQMPLYAKLTSKTSSACPGSSFADKATANKNAGVTFTSGGQYVAYGGPGVTDNNITWIQLAFDSARGFNNITGLFSSFGYVGAPYGVATNITNNQFDYVFDPTGTPPQSGGNTAHNILNATDEKWFCAFAGSGTVDLTSCLRGASVLRTQPTGAITLNAPASGQFMQFMTLMFQGTGGSPATITFNTNFAATSSLTVGADSTKYWIITFVSNANSPLGSSSWYEVSRSVNGAVSSAGSNSTVASPAGPNSTSVFTMQGLAGALTPAETGNVSLQICGTIIETGITAAGSGIQYQLSYGTGTAPTSNAALTGTQVGTVQEYMLANTVTAADVFVPFCQTVVVKGLTVGTAYWIDLAAEAVANTGFSFSKVNIAAHEF